MSQPNTEYEFAKDAQYDTSVGPSGSSWHGENNKVLPVEQVVSQGLTPSKVFVPQIFNYYTNSHGRWIGFLSGTVDYVSSVLNSVSGAVENLDATVVDGYLTGAYVERELFIDPWDGNIEGTWTVGSDKEVNFSTNNADWLIGLNSRIPYGATITTCSMICQPGQAESTAGDKMKIILMREDFSFVTGSTGADSSVGPIGYVDSTTNQQTASMLQSYYMDNEERVFLWIQASANAASFADKLWFIRIKFLDPGARNAGPVIDI